MPNQGKKLGPRKKPTIVPEREKIKILNYVRDNYEPLFGEWSNGRPKRSCMNAWKDVFDLATR